MAFEVLISAYTLSNYPLLLSSFLTFLFGYLEYIYSFLLVLHDRKSPYPIWMHTFYFAHDSTWSYRLFLAARQNNYHWFLTSTSAALLLWNIFEVFNLYAAVTIERQEIWGGYTHKPVTKTYAVLDIFLQVSGFYCVVNLLIEYMGEDSLFQWFLFTNILMAWGPGVLWRQRVSRDGCSAGLGIVIVLATINTFAPWNMWGMVMPMVFGGFWWRVAGVVFTVMAIGNLVDVVGKPGKKAGVRGGWAIW